jgi:phosphopantothenoylcysteine decarboxylase/phosphopantothenate--cysteine ligase
MHRAVLEHLPGASVVIMAAAVADYRPVAPTTKKIKRRPGPMTLELESTPDILADVARQKSDRILVGFAAETEDVGTHARGKLSAKQADLIVANDVTAPGSGFDHDTNVVTLYPADGSEIAVAAHEQARRRRPHPGPRARIAPRARSRARRRARNADAAATRGAHVAPASNVRR